MARPVYLLLGPEDGAKGDRIKEIYAEAAKAAGSDPDRYHFYPTDDGWEEKMYGVLTTNSLFSPASFVILSQVESLSDPEAKRLCDYVSPLLGKKPPSTPNTLILVSSQTYLPPKKKGVSKLQALFPRDKRETFYELFDSQKESWVRSQFQRRKVAVTPDGIQTLLDLVENNTLELRIAIAQIALFWQIEKKKGAVTGEDIESYIANTRMEDSSSLFAAIMKHDLSDALRILHQIFAMGDSSTSTGLYFRLSWQLDKFLAVAETYARTRSLEQAFSQSSVGGRPVSIRNPRDKSVFGAGLRNYPLARARDMRALYGRYEVEIKRAGDMQTLVWEDLIAKMITA